MFNGLTNSEKDFVRIAKENNCLLLRNGWPDFMVIHGDLIIAVEVKHGVGQLNSAQHKMRELFAKIGIPYFISREGAWPPRLGLMLKSPLPIFDLTNKHLVVLREAKSFCESSNLNEFHGTDLTDGIELSRKQIYKICKVLVDMGYFTKRKGEGRGAPNLYRFATTPAAQKSLSRLFAMFDVDDEKHITPNRKRK